MITGVAFCPQAPALVPEVGRGLDAELGPVRAASRAAIRRVASPGTRILVIGSGARCASYGPTSRGSFAGFGVDLVVPLGSEDDGPVELPPSLAVGAWLVRDALGPGTGATGFATATGFEETPELQGDDATAVVVVGDGSARRSAQAPGHLDERATAFDARVAAALAAGEAGQLPDDGPLAAGLMVAGASAWRAAARLLSGTRWAAELGYDAAPFGVGYFVAAWVSRWSPGA